MNPGLSHSEIVATWTEKQVESLLDDNMLRGSWAEHLVAHFLEISERVPQWSYFDLKARSGTRISVKQSVHRSEVRGGANGSRVVSISWRRGRVAPGGRWGRVLV